MTGRLLVLISLCSVVAGCREPVTPGNLEGFFALVSVEGHPVPFTTDSTAYDGGFALNRIYGRSLLFYPGDSARYTYGTETRNRRADGTLDPQFGSSRCILGKPIRYAVQGATVLLMDWVPPGEAVVPFDTLVWNGRTLVQRDFVGGDLPHGSRFEYRKEPPRDVCAGIGITVP